MNWLKTALELGKLKGVGIIMALIVLVGVFGWGYYKTITNHFHDTQNVLRENAKAIMGMTEVMTANIEVSKNTNELIKDFRQELRAK